MRQSFEWIYIEATLKKALNIKFGWKDFGIWTHVGLK